MLIVHIWHIPISKKTPLNMRGTFKYKYGKPTRSQNGKFISFSVSQLTPKNNNKKKKEDKRSDAWLKSQKSILHVYSLYTSPSALMVMEAFSLFLEQIRHFLLFFIFVNILLLVLVFFFFNFFWIIKRLLWSI